MRKTTAVSVLFFLLSVFFFSPSLLAQKGIATVGIAIRPLIPINYFDVRNETLALDSFTTTFSAPRGLNYGMLIRSGITDMISIETGIYYTSRRYSMLLEDNHSDFSDKSNFTFVAYEIPVLGLIYIQLSEKVYMNNAMGVSMSMFPSNIFTQDTHFDHWGYRYRWNRFGLLANVGFEYRTEKSGYFYLGASYQTLIGNMIFSRVDYFRHAGIPQQGQNVRRTERGEFAHSGSYFTIDLRYFFHEEPLAKQKRAKRKN
jgi:hypothetical protein